MVQARISEDWLEAYAIGDVDEAMSALIAAHLTYCSVSREAVEALQNIGGALLDQIDLNEHKFETTEFDYGAFKRSVATTMEPRPDVHRSGVMSEIVPRPLLDYALATTGKTELEDLSWEHYSPGIERALLPTGEAGEIARFLRSQPGARFPYHDHGSQEITVVLSGAYRDDDVIYSVGDVQQIDVDQTHAPLIIGDETCLSFVVSTSPPILLDGRTG